MRNLEYTNWFDIADKQNQSAYNAIATQLQQQKLMDAINFNEAVKQIQGMENPGMADVGDALMKQGAVVEGLRYKAAAEETKNRNTDNLLNAIKVISANPQLAPAMQKLYPELASSDFAGVKAPADLMSLGKGWVLDRNSGKVWQAAQIGGSGDGGEKGWTAKTLYDENFNLGLFRVNARTGKVEPMQIPGKEAKTTEAAPAKAEPGLGEKFKSAVAEIFATNKSAPPATNVIVVPKSAIRK